MTPLMICIVGVALGGGLLLLVALASASKRAESHGRGPAAITTLSELRSPTGKPFFADGESLREFVDVLHTVRDLNGARDERRRADGGASAPRRRQPRAAVTPRQAR